MYRTQIANKGFVELLWIWSDYSQEIDILHVILILLSLQVHTFQN
jgi:hypothetical protein